MKRIVVNDIEWVDVEDLVTLLDNIHLASQDLDIGFEDANRTTLDVMRDLNKKVYMKRSLIESCLWASNLLNEKQKFRHHRGLTFDQFVAKMVGNKHFDTTYNVIEEKGK